MPDVRIHANVNTLLSVLAGVAAATVFAAALPMGQQATWMSASITVLAFLAGALGFSRYRTSETDISVASLELVPYAVVHTAMVSALGTQSISAPIASVASALPLSFAWFLHGQMPRGISAAPGEGGLRASAKFDGWPGWYACGVFAFSLLALEFAWGSRFYIGTAHVGHDFALSGIGLLEAKYWLDVNGVWSGLFNPPWFTPAWCAGAAFFADPQSAFYSTLTLLTLFVDPFRAAHLNMLLYAAVAYWGSYAAVRRVFDWPSPAAVVFATLAMANAFLPMRSAIGELGYQPLYLWTLLVLALCWDASDSNWRRHLWPILCVALVLTAWLHAAFAGMMIPTVLGALMLCLIAALAGRVSVASITLRMIGGGLLAVSLNISKLYESASLMQNFPREFYALPGFPQMRDAVLAVGYSLLQPSQWTAEFGLRKLVDVRFTALPHEWAMHFGLGAVVMVVLSALVLVVTRRSVASPPNQPRYPSLLVRLVAIGAIVAIGLVPILLLWANPAARDLFKQIPILNSAAWPMRWVVVYLPTAQWLLAIPAMLALRHLSRINAMLLATAAAVVVWAGPLTEPIDYYLDQRIQEYDPRPVREAYERSRTAQPPAIREVVGDDVRSMPSNRNDTMLNGLSQGHCYNPLYGYRLEAFPQRQRLYSGPVLEQDTAGMSIIFNPACLVHPAANRCTPGDGFRMNDPAQRDAAQRFVSRRPFIWARAPSGDWLAVVSQSIFWLLAASLCVRLCPLAIKMGSQSITRSPPNAKD